MAGSTTIRELLTVLGVKTETKELAAFDKKVELAKKGMEGAAKMAAILTGAVVAGTVAIAGIVASTVAAGSAVADGAARTALSAREYQTLGFVAQQSGASVEQLETALKGLNKRTTDAAEAGKDYVDLVNGQTLSLKGANGETLTQAQLMAQLADKIAAATSGQERMALAAAALGERAGPELVAALSGGSKGLAAMEARAEALGLVMSEQLVDGADELGDRLDEVKGVVGGLRNAIAERLIPVANDLLKRLVDWYEINGKLIRSRLAWWAERIANGVRALAGRVVAADAVVQRVFGGWRPILIGIAGAVGLVSTSVGGLAGLKAWFAIKSALAAISLLVSAVAAALGIGFWPAVAVISAFAAVVALAAAGVVFFALQIEDLVVYLQGGNSAMGEFIERNREAQGALGGLARWLEANLIEIQALGELLTAVGQKFWEAFGPGITGMVHALSAALQTLFGWITSVADAFIGAKLDERAAATGERVSFIRGLTASITGDSGAVASAAVGPGAAAGGSSRTSNSVQQSISVSVGSDANAGSIRETILSAMDEANRGALSAMSGAEV